MAITEEQRARWKREFGRNRSLEAVRDVLAGALKKNGLDKEFARYSFVLHWKDIVGEQLARVTKPGCIKGSCLHVLVPNSAMAQELSLYRPTILRRLRQYLHRGDTVTTIQVLVNSDLR